MASRYCDAYPVSLHMARFGRSVTDNRARESCQNEEALAATAAGSTLAFYQRHRQRDIGDPARRDRGEYVVTKRTVSPGASRKYRATPAGPGATPPAWSPGVRLRATGLRSRR